MPTSSPSWIFGVLVSVHSVCGWFTSGNRKQESQDGNEENKEFGNSGLRESYRQGTVNDDLDRILLFFISYTV